MKVLIQRSKNSKVLVGANVVGEIPHGMVLFVCFEKQDQEAVLSKAMDKILGVRIFEDPVSKKMDRNILQIQGQILCISQFTLSWDGSKGMRPSFDNSMGPAEAQMLYEKFCSRLESKVAVAKGIFAADMEVSIVNDGPVTFFLSF